MAMNAVDKLGVTWKSTASHQYICGAPKALGWLLRLGSTPALSFFLCFLDCSVELSNSPTLLTAVRGLNLFA